MAEAKMQNTHNNNTGMSRKSNCIPEDANDSSESSQQLIERLQYVISLVGPAKEEINLLQQSVSNHQDTAQLQRELREARTENAKLQQNITSNNECDKLSNELKQAKAQIEGFRGYLKKREGELVEKHKEEINAFKDVNFKTEQLLQETLKKEEEKRNKLVSEARKVIQDNKEENTKLSVALNSMKDEKRTLEEELSATKSRLSKLMGDKLSDNNPDIADLSDQNRPTKIAEKYQELYDNEWTDAYEAAEKHFKDKEEKTRIRLLTKILIDVHEFCEKEFAAQDKELVQALHRTAKESNGLPDVIKKQIKDIKRHTAKDGIENITLKFLEDADKTTQLGSFIDQVSKYVHGCVTVCWLMVHQDPPLTLNLSILKDERFDTNRYKAYTVTGTMIDFIVWPTLLLHKDGPVLSKGIAQCRKQFQGSKSVRTRSQKDSLSEMGVPTGSVRITRKDTPGPADTTEWLIDARDKGNKTWKAINKTEDTINPQMSDLKIKDTISDKTIHKETSALGEKDRQNAPSYIEKTGDQTIQRHKQSVIRTRAKDSSLHHHVNAQNMQNQAYCQPEQPAQQFHSEAHVQVAPNQSAAIAQQQTKIEPSLPSQNNYLQEKQPMPGYSQPNTTQPDVHATYSNMQQNQPPINQQPQIPSNYYTGQAQHHSQQNTSSDVHAQPTHAYRNDYPSQLIPTQNEFYWFQFYSQRYNAYDVRPFMGATSYDKCKSYNDWLNSFQ